MSNPMRHDVELLGCTPEPLMAYLKALGILRLVSEQKDPEARGWWKNDVFWLRSVLDRDGLVNFFLEEYRPTPIVGPWAGGSGFFGKGNREAVEKLAQSDAPRVELYRRVICAVRAILTEEGLGDKPKDAEKSRLIRRYRRELPDEVVAWMDTVMILQQEGQKLAPLLGTGGNDGRLDFTQNFMQRIVLLGLHESGNPGVDSRQWLDTALFASPSRLRSATVGQFAPGRAGGPNATQGMEGDATDNPWDFVLMLEGAVMLAGAAVRRYGVDDSARAAFPFTVGAVGAGFDSAASSDEAESRGELWLPLWMRPASVHELVQLFGEGRAEVCGRAARNGTDFARAVAALGVDRGIAGFSRLGFLKRSGKAYLAAPLGRFTVTARADVDLLREADPWLDRFRRAAAQKEAPPRFASALRGIDSAIFDFCKYGGARFFQEIIVALGQAERELATAEQFRNKVKIAPLGGLSADWIRAADDGSPEFAVARALASIYDGEGRVLPIRSNLEPVTWDKNRPVWAEKERCVVWNAADLCGNLAGVLARRMMDGARMGCARLPLAARFSVPTDVIAAFLSGELDDERIEQLMWGLMLVNMRDNSDSDGRTAGGRDATGYRVQTSAPLPPEYALLKLLFLPGPIVPERSGERVLWRLARQTGGDSSEAGLIIRPEPRILPLLGAGRVGEACRIAAQRLRVSGLPPMPGPLPDGRTRDDIWSEIGRIRRLGRRLAAALLIPIAVESVDYLVRLVCRADDAMAAEALVSVDEGESQ